MKETEVLYLKMGFAEQQRGNENYAAVERLVWSLPRDLKIEEEKETEPLTEIHHSSRNNSRHETEDYRRTCFMSLPSFAFDNVPL